MQNKASKAVVIRCQSSSAPNLQLLLPTQALPPVAEPEPTSDEPANDVGASLRMVPVKRLAKQLSPQNHMVISIVTPHDTAGSNVALDAALRADKTISRCSHSSFMLCLIIRSEVPKELVLQQSR